MIRPALALCVLLAAAAACAKKDAGPRVYKVTVDALVASPDRYIGRGKEVLVHGWVFPGSVTRSIENGASRTLFELEEKGARITVSHAGPIPDLLKDRAETMVHGTVSRGEYSLVVTTGEGGIMMVMPKIP